MKATGIVRRVEDLGRIVVPKEIRRSLRIREGGPSLTTLTPIDRFCMAIHSVVERYKNRSLILSLLHVLFCLTKFRKTVYLLGGILY